MTVWSAPAITLGGVLDLGLGWQPTAMSENITTHTVKNRDHMEL